MGDQGKPQEERPFQVERVVDLDTAWSELKSLFLEFDTYHQNFRSRQLLPDWEDRLKDRLRLHDDRLVLFARFKTEAIGCLVAVIRRNDGLGIDTYGYLTYAFVRERYRRAGVGRALLEAAEQWCQDRGATRVELDVDARNGPGRQFWSWSGYKLDSFTMAKPLERAS